MDVLLIKPFAVETQCISLLLLMYADALPNVVCIFEFFALGIFYFAFFIYSSVCLQYREGVEKRC